ncbi:MAG: MFS transporter [Negativicutes bacterium]|nr:MFS transporter [Negativicutes bacterium]
MSQITTESQPGVMMGKLTRFRWVVAALIFVIYSVAAADRANIGVALPFIRKEFVMSNTEAGGIISLFFVGYSLGQIPAGFLCSKLGVRRVFSFFMIATSIFTGMIGTSGSIFLLKLYRLGLGLAEAPLPIGLVSTINHWFPAKEKGLATGIFLAAAKFGPVLVPPVCAVIIQMAGWREIFLIFAIPGVILSVIWFFLVKNDPAESRFCSPAEVDYIKNEQVTESKTIKRKEYNMVWLDKIIRAKKVEPLDTTARTFRSWDIWGICIGYFLITGIGNVILAWIPTYLMVEKKLSIMQMGFVASAPWVGGVMGNLIGGWFSDNIVDKRRKPTMFITTISTACTMFALVHAPNDKFLLALFLFFTGLLLNIGYSSFLAYPMGLTTKKIYPIAASVVNTGGQAGGACAPLIAGMILDAYSWNIVFLFLASCSALCVLVLLTISEPVDKPAVAAPAGR